MFAYPFGNPESIDRSSVAIASERFSYSFTNVRGNLEESYNRHLLFRQNLVPGMPLWLVEAFLEGRVDWRYRSNRLAMSAL